VADEPAGVPAARDEVVLTGMGAASVFGRGAAPLLDGASTGVHGFDEVTRFDVRRRRVRSAAHMPGSPDLASELVAVIEDACEDAALSANDRARCLLLLAAHADRSLTERQGPVAGPPAESPGPVAGPLPGWPGPVAGPLPEWPGPVAEWPGAVAEWPGAVDGIQTAHNGGGLAASVASRCGLLVGPRVYTAACVAASSAVADAAAMIAHGRVDRVVVAAGYLVDEVNFAVFDAGRALARDGRVRPFSAGRKGILLGDGVAAVVLESGPAARSRRARPLAVVAGWGRAGDAYHVCQPRPDGAGLAGAVRSALRRAAVTPDEVGYVNANGTGTPQSDAAEAAGLSRALGESLERIPVSSTKSVHGHALEASALLELVVTVLALRSGVLPVNAGFLEPDASCALDLVLDVGRHAQISYALSVNFAFGGANTALRVGAA